MRRLLGIAIVLALIGIVPATASAAKPSKHRHARAIKHAKAKTKRARALDAARALTKPSRA